jgi:hypothetical protein
MYRDNGGIIGSLVTTTASSLSAGNKSSADLKTLFESLISIGSASGVWDIRALYSKVKNSVWPSAVANAIAQSGGTMTLNSVSLGSYDYTFYSSSQTVSSFSNADYFTTTADSRSALIYINGNLTINSGQTFIPSNRKLFTALYINGNLTNNGTISMTGRGANHSGTGSNISAGAIKIATGTFGGVTDPNVPSSGGAGGSAGSGSGGTGSAGSAGGTGGGGGGANNNGGSTAQAGSAGTSFTGGTGGGEANGTGGTTTAGATSGGKGGNGSGNAAHSCGTGNPGGTDGGGGGTNYTGNDGTGGVLMIFVKGTLSGSGTVVANGVNNIYGAGSGGAGSSGGGSATLIYTTDSSTVTITANGGSNAGVGGAGTARKLSGL